MPTQQQRRHEEEFRADFSHDKNRGRFLYKYPLPVVSWMSLSRQHDFLTVSKRIDGYQDMSNVRLVWSLARLLSIETWIHCSAYIYFGIFESLLQVVVYSFIRNLAQKCKVRHAHLFLFRTFKDSFLDLGFPSSASWWIVRTRSILLAACALGDGL